MDEQAALEAILSVLMARFSGTNLIHEVHFSFGASVIASEAKQSPPLHLEIASLRQAQDRRRKKRSSQ